MAEISRRAAMALTLAGGLAGGGSGARAQGRALSLVVGANINTLDPHNTASVGTDLSVISHLHAALLIRAPDMSLQPQLATSWRVADDLTWRFTLRDGVTFANGEKLDAEAVRWNFARVLDPQFNARIRPWFSLVKAVAAITPTELEIRTTEPFPTLPAQLSAFFLLPPRWTASHNPANEAIGAGPYELVAFTPGDRIILRAREGWWGDAQAFDTVTFRIIPEAGARIAAVLAGEADLITNVPPSEFQRINASARATAAAVDSTRIVFIKFNLLQPPLADNLALRRALNAAVDREGIRDTIWGGMGSLTACQMLTPAYFGFNPDLRPPAYDPALARRLLAEAGIRPGQLSLEMDVPVGPYLLATDVAQAIAAQLQDVGVNVRIVEMEFGAFMNKYLRAHNMAQMAYLTYAWPTLDADGILSLFEAGVQYAYWNDQTLTGFLKEARQTTDPDRRRAIYKQATVYMCDQAPVLWLFTQPVTYATSKRVAWQARGDDWIRAWDFSLR